MDVSNKGLKGPWLKKNAYPLAFVAMVALYLVLVFYFEPAHVIFSDDPNAWIDYDTHIEQTWRVTEALDGWGKSWAYDVQLLAGYPNGTIFDADNKGWELFTFALWKMGLSKGMAFNLFILLAHLMVPWVVFFSSRLFGLDKWAALLATFMGLLLWYFDAYPRWCWWVGMTAYGMASYFVLLPFSLFYRYLKSRKWYLLVLLAFFLSIGHLIHPYTFVILVWPMMLLYIRAFKTLSLAQHIGILMAALTVVAVNLYWLAVALRFWHYILNSAFYAQSTLSFLLTDYLGLLNEPLVTGVIGNCTGFRFIFLLGSIFGLWLFRKGGDDRFWPFAIGIGMMLVLAYFGGYSLVFSQIQPYRHVLPAMYLTLIPAAVFFVEVWRKGVLKKLPSLTYAVGGLGLLIVTGSLARDMAYFFPERFPEKKWQLEDELALHHTNEKVFQVEKWHMPFKHEPIFEDFKDVVKWLKMNDDGQGRVLVEWWILGEHLAWASDSQILGGFLERNLEHSQANLFRRYHDKGTLEEAEIEQYFIDYAVKWVILSHYDVELEKYSKLMRPIGYIPPIHRVYQTAFPVSYFAEGTGHVEASLNRIKVTDTKPDQSLVLRFHWLETLVCKEGCRIRKEPLENDPVGFIRVLAPHPANFTIENGY